MSRIKVGVVGVGHLGAIHTRIYSQLPEAELIGVYDTDPARAQEVAQAHKTKAFPTLRGLLAQVQAVSIAVPTMAHHKIARICLQAGAHVLVEKPLTRTLPQANSLLKIARGHRRVLQVGHVERFNSAFQGIAQILKNPKFIECHRLGPFTRRGTDVGVVLDLMIHDIDIILWLIKSPVKKIEAVGVSILSGSEDIANARITFASGTVANLTASRVTPETLRKIRLFQDDTYISVDYAAQAAKVFQKQGEAITQQDLPIEREEPLKRELSAFLTAVREEAKPVVSGDDGREALRVALQITRQIHRNMKAHPSPLSQ